MGHGISSPRKDSELTFPHTGMVDVQCASQAFLQESETLYFIKFLKFPTSCHWACPATGEQSGRLAT